MTIRETISLVFLVLFPLSKAAWYGLLYFNRDDLLFRKRNKSAMYVASLAGWLAYFNLAVSIYGGIPCVAFYVTSLLVAPMSVGPQIIRALNVRGEIKYSQLVVEDDISTRAERRKGGQLSSIPSESKQRAGSSSPQQMTKMMEAGLVLDRTSRVVKLTKWALMVIPAALLVLSLALSTDATQLLATDFNLCQPEPTYFQYASPAFGIASTALALIVTILVKKIDDELGLRIEIQRNAILLGCTYIVIIIMRFMGYHEWQPLLQTIQQMMLSFSMAIAPFLSESTINLMASWAKRQGHRINPATRSAVPAYARSLPNLNHRGSTRLSQRLSVVAGRQSLTATQNDERANREVAVSWDAGLCILLSTEDGINLFSQHCAREFSSENIRFWCAVNDYRAMFDDEKCIPTSKEVEDKGTHDIQTSDHKIDIVAIAEEIYDQFICDRSKTQINVSSKQNGEIKQAIQSREPKKDLFDDAQREIFSVMSRDSYPRFLASKKNRTSYT